MLCTVPWPHRAYPQHHAAAAAADGDAEALSTAAKTQTAAEQFTGEIDHFSQVVAENGTVRTPGEMGLRDVRLIEALYRAARERRWIDLKPDMTMRTA